VFFLLFAVQVFLEACLFFQEVFLLEEELFAELFYLCGVEGDFEVVEAAHELLRLLFLFAEGTVVEGEAAFEFAVHGEDDLVEEDVADRVGLFQIVFECGFDVPVLLGQIVLLLDLFIGLVLVVLYVFVGEQSLFCLDVAVGVLFYFFLLVVQFEQVLFFLLLQVLGLVFFVLEPALVEGGVGDLFFLAVHQFFEVVEFAVAVF
jgi:hypothetical protein